MLLLNKFYKKSTTTETKKKPLKKNTSGATAIEYALVAACIAVGLIATLQSLKTSLSNKFSNIASDVTAAK